MASRIIRFDRGLKKRAHPHATATFTTAPRRRKRTSLNRRRFTTTFYDTSRRRQPHSRQPVVRVPSRSKLQSGQTGVSCINQVRAPELDHGRVWLLALPAPLGILVGERRVAALNDRHLSGQGWRGAFLLTIHALATTICMTLQYRPLVPPGDETPYLPVRRFSMCPVDVRKG